MLFKEFCGGAYRARSTVLDAEACVNLFLETIRATANAKQSVLMGTPGLRQRVTAGTVECRGSFSQDDVTLTVLGDTLYVVDLTIPSATAVAGTIVDDGLPVTYACNGRGGEQVAITGGGNLYVYDLLAGTLSAAITLPLTNAAVMVDFIDTYFVLVERDTVRVWFSALEDGTTWDALDFFAPSQTSSNVIGIKALRNRLYVLQSLTGSIYYDTGDADNPFAPYPGTVFHEGLVGPWAIGLTGESVCWVTQDATGGASIVQASDANPQRISTPAIDFALGAYDDLSTCEVFSYTQEGHSFIGWTFPVTP